VGTSRTPFVALVAAIALVLGPVGCDGSKKEDAAKVAPDAHQKPPELSKPAGNTAGAESQKDRLPAAPAPEPSGPETADTDGAEDVADDAPPVDVDRPRRASSKRDRGRKRASTATPADDRRDSEEEPEPTEPAPLKLKRILFAESIASREPVDPEETFAASQVDKLYAFVEVVNDTKQKSKIVVRFIPPSGSPSKVTLDVGDKSRWRTWALRRGVAAVGTWTVTVSDAGGNEIGRRTFEVTE
jgi:hypothetical protein